MATTFSSKNPVNTKPLHSGTVIYADETCIRSLSSELLGGGGGIEIAGALCVSLGLIVFPFTGVNEESSSTVAIWLFSTAIFLIIFPILLFRYKPNYPIFSRKSQEIYYVKSPKNVISFKWADTKAEYRRVSVFTGSAVSKIDTLTLFGTSQYGDKPPKPAVIAFIVTDEKNAKEFWSYLQTYMKDGANGLEKPGYDWVKEGFLPEATRLTKQAFYDAPKDVLHSVFSPTSNLSIWFKIILLPLAILFFPIAIIFIWPAQLATALVGSTRKRAPIPEDILKNISNNPESWGKES